jgi:hypothetical protein
MRKSWILAALMGCLTPAAAAAQLSWVAGAHAATRVGDSNVNNWRGGVQIAVATSDYVAFSLAANVIFAYMNDNPDLELTGWNSLVTVRTTPLRKIWYLGAGVSLRREQIRFVRVSRQADFVDKDFRVVWLTGFWYPFGRLRPFAEIQAINLIGGGSIEPSYVFGLDLKIN